MNTNTMILCGHISRKELAIVWCHITALAAKHTAALAGTPHLNFNGYLKKKCMYNFFTFGRLQTEVKLLIIKKWDVPWRLLRTTYGYHRNDKTLKFAAIPRIQVTPIAEAILTQIRATLVLWCWFVTFSVLWWNKKVITCGSLIQWIKRTTVIIYFWAFGSTIHGSFLTFRVLTIWIAVCPKANIL